MKIFKWTLALTALSAVFDAQIAKATIVAVGVYDEQTTQTNQVDFDAPYNAASSTGVGANPALVVAHDTFAAHVLARFSAGNSGVAQFDDPNEILAGSRTNSFTTSFDGGTKSLTATNISTPTNGGHLRTNFTSTNRTSISGPLNGFLAKSDALGDTTNQGNYVFTLTENGFDVGEHVRAVGATILARNGGAPLGNWTMRVTLDNGDVIGAFRGVNSNSGNALDDTFFGAYAPAGRYITGVSWISAVSTFTGLDDFGFITSTGDIVVPEPASLTSAIAGMVMFATGLRRRSV